MTDLYHFKKRVNGPSAALYGNCTRLSGDCTRLSGDCSGLEGDIRTAVSEAS